MISPNAKLTVTCLLLEQIQICQYEPRDMARMLFFADLLQKHPGMYAGIWHVEPSKTHQGMYSLLEGHRRYVASVMTGRKDAICLIVEEVQE